VLLSETQTDAADNAAIFKHMVTRWNQATPPLFRKGRNPKRLANKTKCLLSKRAALSLLYTVEPTYIQ